MTRKHTVIVKLKRSGTGRPWGIRIAGGADLDTPIVVTRSENEALQRGDVIKKIDDYDTRDMRHVDAQNLLQNSETIKLVVERSESSRATTSSRITTDTTITMSPSTVFKSIFGDGAAVTSLSECNTISITTRFLIDIAATMIFVVAIARYCIRYAATLHRC